MADELGQKFEGAVLNIAPAEGTEFTEHDRKAVAAFAEIASVQRARAAYFEALAAEREREVAFYRGLLGPALKALLSPHAFRCDPGPILPPDPDFNRDLAEKFGRMFGVTDRPAAEPDGKKAP